MQSTSEKFLFDLSGFHNLKKDVAALLQELKDFNSNAFNLWSRTKLATLSNTAISLNVNKPVVQFENVNQMMVVNFNDELQKLIREARQLTVLGHSIPEQIKKAVEQAKKFMRQAKVLEKVYLLKLKDIILHYTAYSTLSFHFHKLKHHFLRKLFCVI